jgi:flagellar FliL protein
MVKLGLAVAAQIALAFALVQWLGRPWLADRPMPWERDRAAAAEETRKLGPLLTMDEILVNVAETQGRRFFRTSLALEADDDTAKRRVVDRMPVLRGKVIDLLSRKRMDQLVQPTARDTLRLELLTTLNAEMGTGQLRDVHFTEFLVQ